MKLFETLWVVIGYSKWVENIFEESEQVASDMNKTVSKMILNFEIFMKFAITWLITIRSNASK